MNVIKRCPFCGMVYDRDIDVDPVTLLRVEQRTKSGQMIQDLVPYLTADDREFLMTGAHPRCWDRAFGDDK